MVNAPIGSPVEKETIEQAIASYDGNIPKAARLEISPPILPSIARNRAGKRRVWSEMGADMVFVTLGVKCSGRPTGRPAVLLEAVC
ncbi:helix-turn-helix domain-containing protein [Aeromonas bestiarum]|uniref:helix-turn-helix domain-containing protein n=1 Tax=Aeromonas bestiarum TaxID=105751 RepID=UPI00338E458D